GDSLKSSLLSGRLRTSASSDSLLCSTPGCSAAVAGAAAAAAAAAAADGFGGGLGGGAARSLALSPHPPSAAATTAAYARRLTCPRPRSPTRRPCARYPCR